MLKYFSGSLNHCVQESQVNTRPQATSGAFLNALPANILELARYLSTIIAVHPTSCFPLSFTARLVVKLSKVRHRHAPPVAAQDAAVQERRAQEAQARPAAAGGHRGLGHQRGRLQSPKPLRQLHVLQQRPLLVAAQFPAGTGRRVKGIIPLSRLRV